MRPRADAPCPAGPWWLRERFFGKINVQLRSEVVRAEVRDGKALLEVCQRGGETTTTSFDHVIAGTGFEVDVDRLRFLDPVLRASVRRIERAPRLSRHFESSERCLLSGVCLSRCFGGDARARCSAACCSCHT